MIASTYCFSILYSILLPSVTAYTVPLPTKMVAENIVSTGAGNFLMSDVPTGNVVLYNTYSRSVHTVVKAPPGRLIQGLAFDPKRNLIITAGSGTRYAIGMNRYIDSTPNVANVTYNATGTGMNIYDGYSGEEVAQCNATGAVLIKDVSLDSAGDYAYFTDAFATSIYQLDLKQLPECSVKVIPLPYFSEFDPVNPKKPPTFYTGIGAYHNGLIVNSYSAMLTMYLDPSTGYTKILSKGVGNFDGLKIVKNCLYSVDGYSFNVHIFRIHPDKSKNHIPSLKHNRVINDSSFTFTTGLAFSRKKMVVTNANNLIIGNKGQLYLSEIDLPKFPSAYC